MSISNPVFFSGRMLTTDLDGTFLIPIGKRPASKSVEDRSFRTDSIVKATEAVKDNGFDSVLINTGRNFSELKEVEDILKSVDMPIDAIALEDGKRLLKRPQRLTSSQWMAQLFNKDINYLKFEDETWAKNNSAPLGLISDFLLLEEGFIHRKDSGEEMIFSKPVDNAAKNDAKRWEVTLVPPGISLRIKAKGLDGFEGVDVEAYAKELTNKIETLLKDCGYDISTPSTKEELSYFSTFERRDINKASVANYLKNSFNEPTQEVRAGDGVNDIEMLLDEGIEAIQVGNEGILSRALFDKDIIKVPKGGLAQGIEEAARRFDRVV